jgi:mRNA-degrading endonuclease RelE of RelBE toxin-antitoxin system
VVEPQTPLGVRILPAFDRDFRKLPRKIRERAGELIAALAARRFTGSEMGIKKMAGRQEVWEARVTVNYRLTFHMTGTHLILRRIGTHDVLRRP